MNTTANQKKTNLPFLLLLHCRHQRLGDFTHHVGRIPVFAAGFVETATAMRWMEGILVGDLLVRGYIFHSFSGYNFQGADP
jgi:hypothetical protein